MSFYDEARNKLGQPQSGWFSDYNLFNWMYRFYNFVIQFLQDPSDVDITGGTLTNMNSITTSTLVSSSSNLGGVSFNTGQIIAASDGGSFNINNTTNWVLLNTSASTLATYTLNLAAPANNGHIMFIFTDNGGVVTTLGFDVTVGNFVAADFAANRCVTIMYYNGNWYRIGQ